MKLKLYSSAAILSLLFAFCACENKKNEGEEKEKDSGQIAKDFNEKKAIEEKESKFLISAADLSLRGIEMAKLAQRNASDEEIKKLGKKIEDEHSKFMDELKKLATSKSITIPLTLTSAGSREVDQLGKAGEGEFDEKYCSAMVEEQKEAIKKYKAATEDIEDIDIKNWAIKNLPVLRENLDQALTCQQSQKSNKEQNPENQVNTGKNKPKVEITSSQRQHEGSTGGNSQGKTTSGDKKKSDKKEQESEQKK